MALDDILSPDGDRQNAVFEFPSVGYVGTLTDIIGKLDNQLDAVAEIPTGTLNSPKDIVTGRFKDLAVAELVLAPSAVETTYVYAT